jgi:hypothetical protein
MRAKVVTLSLVLMLALLPLAMQSGVAPPGLPALSVTVEDVGEVRSDPVEFVHVHTTATVNVDNFPLGATVQVNASAETWLVTVSPEEFTVPQGQTTYSETINLDIRVPPKASAEHAVEMKVFANTTTTIGIEYADTASTNITVEQFYGLRLTSNGTTAVEQGNNLTSRMRITNTGNGIDNFTITMNNEATLTSKGLEVEFVDSVHDVGRDRTVSVKLNIQAASTAEIGTSEALFTVTSEGDRTKSKLYMVTITVQKGDNGNGNGNGNGNDGTGEEDSGLSTNMMIGIVIVIIIIMGLMFAVARGAKDVEAEDEDYVMGRDEDADED